MSDAGTSAPPPGPAETGITPIPLRWAVGIITARRSPSTLSATYKSLLSAGWTRNQILVSAEQNVPAGDLLVEQLDSSRRAPHAVHHLRPAGCYRNWRFMLAMMLESAPNDDYYLISEDDCQYTAGLRHYLDANPPPRDGIASLYTAAPNHRPDSPGWNSITVPLRAYGALAYCIPPDLARRFHADPPHPKWLNGTDTAMGYFCQREGVKYYCHSPSFVRHTGIGEGMETTLPDAGVAKNRQCAEWAEDAASLHPVSGSGDGSIGSMRHADGK